MQTACVNAFCDGRQAGYLLESSGCRVALAVALITHHRAEKHQFDASKLVLSANHLIGDALVFDAAVVNEDGTVRFDGGYRRT